MPRVVSGESVSTAMESLSTDELQDILSHMRKVTMQVRSRYKVQVDDRLLWFSCAEVQGWVVHLRIRQ